jgi:hypothetical protein
MKKVMMFDFPEGWLRKWDAVEVYGGPDNAKGFSGLIYKIRSGSGGCWYSVFPFRGSGSRLIDGLRVTGIKIGVWIRIIK